jgi:hypothetical protein
MINLRTVPPPPPAIHIIAGNGKDGHKDGVASQAQFSLPRDICSDKIGNIFVTCFDSNIIRKIAPEGMVSTLVGEGTNIEAEFNSPGGMCTDKEGNIYVCDRGNHRIRKISPEGCVSTIAGNSDGYRDGRIDEAQFSRPTLICSDTQGNLIVVDKQCKIRRITAEGIVSTIAGSHFGDQDGEGINAKFELISSICMNCQDIIVSDSGNNKIKRISPKGTVSTILSGGPNPGSFPIRQENFRVGQVCGDPVGNIYFTTSRLKKIPKHSYDIIDQSFVTYVGNNGYHFGDNGIAKISKAGCVSDIIITDLDHCGLCCDREGNLVVALGRQNKIVRIVVHDPKMTQLTMFFLKNLFIMELPHEIVQEIAYFYHFSG